jgi:phosphate transport system protein
MILDMAKLAEKAVVDSIYVYQKEPGATTDSVYQLSEQLRILRDETSGLAVELLARYQPLARDLRFIKSCIDIAYDLSRFGRYAYDIALTPDWLGEMNACEFAVPFDMARKAIGMIDKSITAFRKRDVDLAKSLQADDDVIDKMYKAVIVNMIQNGSSDCMCEIATALLVRHVERIADHACYIADSVVYIVEGERLGIH